MKSDTRTPTSASCLHAARTASKWPAPTTASMWPAPKSVLRLATQSVAPLLVQELAAMLEVLLDLVLVWVWGYWY
jgi:hypothetical protein